MRLCGHAITMIACLHGPALKELQILSEHYKMWSDYLIGLTCCNTKERMAVHKG